MKLEIELDLNKIDYDAINKQIAEKVAALDIKEMYNVESRIDSKISRLIENEVDLSYNSYIDKYWRSATSEGKNLIESMSKDEIKKRINTVLEEIFEEFDESALREIMFKILPNVVTSIIFERVESALINKEYNYRNETVNVVMSMVNNEISKRFRNF